MFFLPALDFFRPAFGVAREKDTRLRKCFLPAQLVAGKRPRVPEGIFFLPARMVQKKAAAWKRYGFARAWGCLLASASVAEQRLNSILPALGSPGKGHKSPKGFFSSAIGGGRKLRVPEGVFASAYGAKKKKLQPGTGVVLPGHGGAFLPVSSSPSASLRRNAVEERRPFAPCDGEKAQRKTNFETWSHGFCEESCKIQHGESCGQTLGGCSGRVSRNS